MRVVDPDQGVRPSPLEPLQVGAASADDELDHAARVVRRAVRRLGGEPLVVVVVAAQDQLGARRVQLVPECSGQPGSRRAGRC